MTLRSLSSALVLASLASACTPEAPLRTRPDADRPDGDASVPAEDAALDFVAFEIGHDVDASIEHVRKDDLGFTHARMRQQVNGVEVFGGAAIAHMNDRAEVVDFTDGFLRDIDVDTTPSLVERTAFDTAVAAVPAGPAVVDSEADLQILRHEGVDHLTWRVQLDRMDGSADSDMPVVFVDAHTGQVVWQYNNLRTATGSGTGHYTSNVSLETTASGGQYYLENGPYGLGTYTYSNTTSSLYYLTDADNRWTDSAHRSGVDAHYAGTKTLEYYEQAHGWTGLDGRGGPDYVGSITGNGAVISMFVNYGQNYANAAWTGQYMLFGDGDGTELGPLTTLDVTGHEMTHGVVENTAGLVYSGESGALDESFADVFGALAERHAKGDSYLRWWIGEECMTPGRSGDALRYMDDPTRDGVSRDHYSSRYTGSQDNGGVHLNSGIGNLAFYLLANGGTHPSRGGSMQGIGVERAAEIWFRALTTYMTSRTDFAGARTATRSAAADLYGQGSTEHEAVAQAWALVGVGTYTAPDPDPQPNPEPEPEPEPEPTACSGLDEAYSGSLSGTGASAYEPDGSYYYTRKAGTHEACLTGPSSADFDLTLYKWNGSGWTAVASSEGSDSNESISYTGDRGYYLWKISAYSGSGSYELGLTRP